MQIERLDIPDVFVLTPKRFGDARGYFTETFRADVMADIAPGLTFVQDNQSGSAAVGTVRGLHFQTAPHAQAKLVRVTRGAILDVAVDLRRGSPYYGKQVHSMLSAENGSQLFVPVGFAHGFCTLAPDTEVTYKVSTYYNAAADRGLAWNDPALGIPWPVAVGKAVLSAKDQTHPNLSELPAYFTYGA
jgi:dTDP-4-dehydrorhamnose 3,5-epimerase